MHLELTVSCDVELNDGDSFEWSTNREDAFEFRGDGPSAVIRQITRGGTTIIGDVVIGNVVSSGRGNVVMQSVGGRSVVMNDGGIWINGQRVDQNLDGGGIEPPKPEPRLTITLPKDADVTVKTSGSSRLFGNAQIKRLAVSTSGSTEIDLTAHHADLRTSGSSDICLCLTGGGVRSHFSGSTDFAIVPLETAR